MKKGDRVRLRDMRMGKRLSEKRDAVIATVIDIYNDDIIHVRPRLGGFSTWKAAQLVLAKELEKQP